MAISCFWQVKWPPTRPPMSPGKPAKFWAKSTACTDKTQILSTTIYLADIATFADMNSVWDHWVPQGHLPARATVEAKLANPSYQVEIQVVAAR